MPIKIIGTGSFLPSAIVGNEELVEGGLVSEGEMQAFREKIGINARHFAGHIDPVACKIFSPQLSELDMALEAGKSALQDAGLEPQDVRLVYLTCTSDENEMRFQRYAILLHDMLEMPPENGAFQLDPGCGGVAQGIDVATDMLDSRREKNILLVASNCCSVHLHEGYRGARNFLPPYIFGDGAAAFVLSNSKKKDGSKVLAHYFASDSRYDLIGYRWSQDAGRFMYRLNARLVKEMYEPLMRRAWDGLKKKYPLLYLEEVDWVFPHQANYCLVKEFCERMEIPLAKVAINVDSCGNLSAASTMRLFDAWLKEGKLKKGDLCFFWVVGAGAQYGAFLVEV